MRENIRLGLCLLAIVAVPGLRESCYGQWETVYAENFDEIPAGAETGDSRLESWSGKSAGVVVDGGRKSSSGRFLRPLRDWQAVGQGPVLKLELDEFPHNRVRVLFDLYTFGDWRGVQHDTRGPAHRLSFHDLAAAPRFQFVASFSSTARFQQSWPLREPATVRGAEGAHRDPSIDLSRPYARADRWPIELEYESDSPRLEFAITSATSAGSGLPMPDFAIDNVRVLVWQRRDGTLPPPVEVARAAGITQPGPVRRTSLPRSETDSESDSGDAELTTAIGVGTLPPPQPSPTLAGERSTTALRDASQP